MEPIDESLVSPPFKSVTVAEVNTTPAQRMYRIICLKRTNFEATSDCDYHSQWFNNSHIVYWMSDYSGYTKDINKAGLYTHEQLHKAAGSHLDWFASPVWPHRL